MREMAWERIGHLYPKARLPDGGEATVIAWLWARTVPCPNPACGVAMPLMRTLELSTKRNNRHWIKPIIDSQSKLVSFVVQDHKSGVPDGATASDSGAICVGCNSAVALDYVRDQAQTGKMGKQMTAIVAEGYRKRSFLSANDEHTKAAASAEPEWYPDGRLPERALGFRVQRYGFTSWRQLFTERQLTALTTFSGLLPAIGEIAVKDGATEDYADALRTYIALAIGKYADGGCAFTRWRKDTNSVEGLFARQAISMVWDFAEPNPFSNSSKNWGDTVERLAKALDNLPIDVNDAEAYQADAPQLWIKMDRSSSPIPLTTTT